MPTSPTTGCRCRAGELGERSPVRLGSAPVTDGSRKAILAAFFANLGIAASKFVGFLLTGSASMLAETVHSLADTGNQALLFLGGKRARRSPTTTHPFGYGRERYFWAFAVAARCCSRWAGCSPCTRASRSCVTRTRSRASPSRSRILLIAIALESWSLRTAVRESRHVKSPSISWWRFIRTTRQPELPVVLLEDLGALIGLFVALIGVGLAGATGNAAFRRRRIGDDRRAAHRHRDRPRRPR